jgi:hypothetical protein
MCVCMYVCVCVCICMCIKESSKKVAAQLLLNSAVYICVRVCMYVNTSAEVSYMCMANKEEALCECDAIGQSFAILTHNIFMHTYLHTYIHTYNTYKTYIHK